ncbi:MAG TPA: DEAD/DEAH box helicase [Pyrinomonadaceae bacterium]|nr:DEAD/DEAH box helicase [Pyrinomonadaceae bacterium]
MSFELLSEPIRRYIRDQRWEELRPIQHAAISKILSTNDNYILASRTASGKTEAAFLPILSQTDFDHAGVQVLYISPLKALINDQFVRVEELCKYLDVPVTKWHGEANQSAKTRLIKRPQGIVLITPESLEAMLVNKPFNVKHLFGNLKFVVIDEIHSFIGTDRGTQLKSIISRLRNPPSPPFRIIGLSATIGDYVEAKRFTGNETGTKVLLDRSAKEVEAQFRYFEGSDSELPLDLVKDLYLETENNKALIFPNSRGRVEEVSVKLKKISDRVQGHSNYFSHHSSVDKDVREYVEFFAKNNRGQNFAIACTSTLELGIDIGTVDEVVQIDATNSISSLIQRLGRSGRRNSEKSRLILYATKPWSFLQSLACWALYQDGFIEPPETNSRRLDILVHQALSITKGSSGIEIELLVDQLKQNCAFEDLSISDIEEIIDHLTECDLFEKLRKEIIIGIEGEKVVNSRNFYSVFTNEDTFKILSSGSPIGDIPFSPQIVEGENLLLAARIWKIIHVDFDAKRIHVIKALDGKKPSFSGTAASVHGSVRQKMLELLYSKEVFNVLNKASVMELGKLRKEFAPFNIQDFQTERPMRIKDGSVELFTFAGTKINNTIYLLLDLAGFECKLNTPSSSFEIETSATQLRAKWPALQSALQHIDEHLSDLIDKRPQILSFSKWGSLLPRKFQVELLKRKYYDFNAAIKFIDSCKFVENC